MRKKLFAIMMLASVLFAAFSCKNDEVEDPTLTLSEMSVQLPKAASEKAITVTTNQTEWTALSNADWIHLTQSGNTLTIKVDANPTAEKRMGEVAVLAVIGKKVVVEQEGSDVSIVAMPDKLEVDQWGGKFQFDVNANTQDWTITTDAKWLKLTPKTFKGEVLVEIDENFDRADRVAKLIFQAQGKATQEFTVTQSGIIYFLLPYLEEKGTLRDLMIFEESRGSVYAGGFFTNDFITASPAFPKISYGFSKGALNLRFLESANADILKDPEFIKFLEENKFKKVSESASGMVFVKEEEKYDIQAEVDLSSYPGVYFMLKYKQDKPYPTFEKFPYGLIDFGTADDNAIDNWEAANGGTLNTELTNQIGSKVYDVALPWLHRMYFMTEKAPFVLNETLQAFDNLNLGFFEAPNGEVFLTNEFKALLDKEGFSFIKQDGVKFYYYKKEIQLVLLVRPFQNKTIANGKKVLTFNLWHADLGSTNIEFKDIENKLRVN